MSSVLADTVVPDADGVLLAQVVIGVVAAWTVVSLLQVVADLVHSRRARRKRLGHYDELVALRDQISVLVDFAHDQYAVIEEIRDVLQDLRDAPTDDSARHGSDTCTHAITAVPSPRPRPKAL